MDGDGFSASMVKIKTELIVDGTEILIDFAGTDDQVDGCINCPHSCTEAAAHYAVKVALDPGEPGTLGAYRPINVSVPKGSLLNPRFPAPVVAGNHETTNRVYDTVVRAVGEIDPELAFATGEGSANTVIYESMETGHFNYTGGAGGMGACPTRDGVSAIRSGVGNAGPQPIERIEDDYDFVQFEEFVIVPDSGGTGEYRGGVTARQIFRLDDPTRLTFAAERAKTQPFGLAGGSGGMSARHAYITPEGEEIDVESKSITELEAGSRVLLRPAGGGGFGNPEDRNQEAVLEDIKNEYITIKAAEEYYGVDIDSSELDTTTTENNRS
jgi:N-methylhydantoinase B